MLFFSKIGVSKHRKAKKIYLFCNFNIIVTKFDEKYGIIGIVQHINYAYLFNKN